ncbi:hypothetical protein [Streptomyces sp. NPDC008092]
MELPVLPGLLVILGLTTAVGAGGCFLGFTITTIHALTRRRS